MYTVKDIIKCNNMMEIYVVEKEKKLYLLKKINNIDCSCLLENEYKALNILKKTNFVSKVFEYSNLNNNNFLVIEYFDGKLLSNYFFDNLHDIISFVYNLCNILEKIHKHGIIHADIKPSNILITKNGDIKILDFGISVVEGKNTTYNSYSKNYCSYEQVLSVKQLSFHTDLYAVGIIFYELIFNKLPFLSDDLKKVCEYVKTDNKYLNIIFDKLFNFNHKNFYKSINEFKEDIKTLINN